MDPDLVRSAPDVIVANTNAATTALTQLTKAIPIVFAGVGDPVAWDGNVHGPCYSADAYRPRR